MSKQISRTRASNGVCALSFLRWKTSRSFVLLESKLRFLYLCLSAPLGPLMNFRSGWLVV